MSSRRLPFARLLAAGLLAGLAAPMHGDDAGARFSISSTATLETIYDTNVMLQSVTPLADIESWVTSLAAQVNADWRPGPHSSGRLSYAPTWTTFEARHSEDSLAQRINASWNSRAWGATYAFQGSAAHVDRSDDPVIWTGPGGPPATGGAAVRDRRDQTVYRGTARAEWTIGTRFERPVAALYIADYQTRTSTAPGCQNNVDRGDLSAGLDLGRTLRPGVSSYLGYRHGRQDQATVLDFREEYDNRYHRFLAGLDGKLASWLTVALSAGPEFRRYGPHVHATFPDRSVTNLFVDATATIAISRTDSLALLARQFEQLSSSGRGAFEDLNLDLAWRHSFSPRTSGALVLHAYNTDILRPTVRNDWLYTARVAGSFAINDAWALEAAITLETGESRVPRTAGREYDRQHVSLAVRAKL